MNRSKYGWLSLLCLLICVLMLASCQPDAPQADESDTAGTAASDTQAPDGMMDCSVSVTDSDGKAVSDVVVKIKQNGADVATKVIGPTGKAGLELPGGTYTFTLESPSGAKFYYDTEAAVITPSAPHVTVSVYKGAEDVWQFSAPSKKVLDGYGPIEAFAVTEGVTYIELRADDYTYLIFNPARGGIYTFTADEGVDITYHGMPILVYEEPRMSADASGVLTIPVEDSSLGSDSVSQLVLRLTAKDGSGKTASLVTVTRTGEIPKSPEELAQWITVEADGSALDALATFKEPAEGDKWQTLTAGTLTNLNIEDPNLPSVVLGTDGYYHLGTADGPMVFIRMTSDSPYVEDFVKMCETDRLRCYFYAEDGTFLRKEGYNTLINAYGALANEDGVVPLNSQLATVIQNIGGYMGWWDYEMNSDIFGDLVIDPAVAWLFACAVYQ